MRAKNQHPRAIRSWVRREGRITRAQQRALERLWPRYGLDAIQTPDLDQVFGRNAPRTLEIGFGNGKSLAIMAEQEPATDFIGVEVHRPGIGHLLMKLAQRELTNVRVCNADALQVLNHCIPDRSLDRVLLFFPDPWPKKRHHKRRIVQPVFIEQVARKLVTGGVLHLATDWENYAEHMLEVMVRMPAFRNRAGTGEFSPRPHYRPVTKFEQRGQRLGHTVRDLIFERI
ncbi:MAG: tRNA (guanosine(46)-N7)-methyltransferase TrmB [Pseudomonadota bacterium]|nr:tRNA (guanosine(46)-N7)-methyltransferase TrmB [Pseudomonadota bacterium]